MELYRIILVDDEEEVRKSIIRKIDWEEAGFFVAGDAENGEDALEKIEALEPDVVLTDRCSDHGYPYALYGRPYPCRADPAEIPLHENRYFFGV